MDSRGVILVVEDDPGMQELLADELSDDGYEVRVAAGLADARRTLREAASSIDLLIADLRLPDGLGTDLLGDAQALQSPPAFLIVTAFGSIADAVAALKQGADDFLTKPLDLEHLRLRVERLLEVRRLRTWANDLRDQGGDVFHGMLGRSAPMQQLFAEIRLVGDAPGPVLIVGESGVGKEMVARALHEESARAGASYIPVNCAAIPEALVESELFGHSAGAFSGAAGSRRGLFEEADGGTLLLDELTELPVTMQAKLLRVLQEGEVRRVGENTARPIDVRVLAATNRDPADALASGDLREDLYYRLETFQIEVPPLRDRLDDVELLATHFFRRLRVVLQKRVEGFTPEALELLRGYPFPGNVRELSSVVQRAMTLCRDGWIGPRDLPARVRATEPATPPSPDAGPQLLFADELPTLDTLRDRYVAWVLERCDGNKRRTAEILGIGRRTLYRYLEGLDDPT